MFKRSLTTGFLAAALGLAAGAAIVASPDVALAGKDCQHSGKIAKVKSLCGSGGFDAVKKAMKKAQKAAKKAGVAKDKIDCKACHSNTKDYPLTDNAVEDFKKLMESHFKS